MTLEVNTQLEQLIRNGMELGAYSSVDQFLEDAVRLLSGQEQWLQENRHDVAEKIEQAYASADRGLFLTEEEVRHRMKEYKAQFLATMQ